MVVSTANLMETVTAGCVSRDTLCRSTRAEVEIWRTFSLSNAKINRKRPCIAEIACPITKSGSRNRMTMSELQPEIHKWPFLSMRSEIWLKIALNAVRLPKFEPLNGISWSPRKIMVTCPLLSMVSYGRCQNS